MGLCPRGRSCSGHCGCHRDEGSVTSQLLFCLLRVVHLTWPLWLLHTSFSLLSLTVGGDMRGGAVQQNLGQMASLWGPRAVTLRVCCVTGWLCPCEEDGEWQGGQGGKGAELAGTCGPRYQAACRQ
jgi:hypothetical protein